MLTQVLQLLRTILIFTAIFAGISHAKPKDSFESFLKDATLMDGYLTVWKKEQNWYLVLDPKMLNQDFLMSSSIVKGLGYGGMFAGTMLSARVVTFRKVQDNIQFIFRNVRNTSTDDKVLKTAVDNAFRDSIYDALPILAEEGGKFLIDAGKFFASDIYDLGSWVNSLMRGRSSFNPRLSYIDSVKNFSQNTEIKVNQVYTERSVGGGQFSVELLIHYSFFPFPDDKFRPRKADQRVGHFLTALRDYSINERPDNYIRYINRWRLEKADPSAEMSLPKKPIIYYLAKNIPHKYRKFVRDGVLEWNKAFEKIGFVGAIEVRIQQDEDTWDPESNSYNTISWIASETPQFGAIGPSRVNPLTGEIVDADILMDESSIRGRTFQFDRAFGRASADKLEFNAKPDDLKEEPVSRPSHIPFWYEPCRASDTIAHQLGLMLLAGSSEGSSDSSTKSTEDLAYYEKHREMFIGQAVKWVTMHEVGHTLGLRHNFKASTVHTLEQLQDNAFVEKNGAYNSVMEYPSALMPAGKKEHHYYYTPTLGAYDYWAIEYAYRVLDEKDEDKKLSDIASRSLEPQLVYATDEDTYGTNDSDSDTYANIYDLGQEPMIYATSQIEFIGSSWDKIVDRLVMPGQSFQDAEPGFFGLIGEYLRNLKFISRYIGGREFSRMHRTTDDKKPLTPVDFTKQRDALEALGKYGFSDTYLQIPASLVESIPTQRWMHWNMQVWGLPVDKEIQRLILLVQTSAFERLFHPRVLSRLIDQENLYRDKNPLTLEEMFVKIHEMVFSEIYPGANGRYDMKVPFISISRRALQRNAVKEFFDLTNEANRKGRTVPYEAKTMSRYVLKKILFRIDHFMKDDAFKKMDAGSRIHLEDVHNRIKHFLESKYIITNF